MVRQKSFHTKSGPRKASRPRFPTEVPVSPARGQGKAAAVMSAGSKSCIVPGILAVFSRDGPGGRRREATRAVESG